MLSPGLTVPGAACPLPWPVGICRASKVEERRRPSGYKRFGSTVLSTDRSSGTPASGFGSLESTGSHRYAYLLSACAEDGTCRSRWGG